MKLTPVDNCPCTCCAEARNMITHGHDNLAMACLCAAHTEAEQCDCAFCASVLNATAGKLTPEQLAAIRRQMTYAINGDGFVDRAWMHIDALLAHCAAVEAERDAALKLVEEIRAAQGEGAEKPLATH